MCITCNFRSPYNVFSAKTDYWLITENMSFEHITPTENVKRHVSYCHFSNTYSFLYWQYPRRSTQSGTVPLLLELFHKKWNCSTLCRSSWILSLYQRISIGYNITKTGSMMKFTIHVHVVLHRQGHIFHVLWHRFCNEVNLLCTISTTL
jgi:hypothetical protein